eukprot:3027365-Rhodomonas_salina.1
MHTGVPLYKGVPGPELCSVREDLALCQEPALSAARRSCRLDDDCEGIAKAEGSPVALHSCAFDCTTTSSE